MREKINLYNTERTPKKLYQKDRRSDRNGQAKACTGPGGGRRLVVHYLGRNRGCLDHGLEKEGCGFHLDLQSLHLMATAVAGGRPEWNHQKQGDPWVKSSPLTVS